MSIILAVASGLFAFIVAAILLSLGMRDRINMVRRLKELTDKETADSPIKKQRQPKRNLPVSRVFANELSTAGIRMRPEEFLILWLCSILLPSGLFLIMDAHPVTITAVVIAGLTAPPLIVYRRKAKRLLLFEKQLSDALMMMGNGLRAGLTLQQTMANIAHEMPDPIAREFARTVKEIQLGSSVDLALNNLVQRVKSMDLMLTVSAIQIQRQVGGNLLEIIENLAATIKDRLKLKDDIRVMTSTGRISGLIVGMIPVAIGGMLMLINPEYIQTFFETSMGVKMLIVAGCMELTGFLVIKRIVTIKY
ncbi:MAG: type II secretion system F family protein [Clostridiaceae bacterium]|nr:type II secretion system F family protein [Clostridiaceae bacterium]